jgi:hypothetical protein
MLSSDMGHKPVPPVHQEACSATAATLPVPAQTPQMMKLPRSRTRQVPQHRMQVFWTTGATSLLWIEKRFPNVIFE